MSKGNSGHFLGTKGSRSNLEKFSSLQIESHAHKYVNEWADKKRTELKGKAKKSFNTACVAFDEITGKYYCGYNGGYHENGYIKNPILYGDSTHVGILPKKSLNKYPVGNCAEVDAINKALNDGANIGNLHIITIHATKKQFGNYKESCENCCFAFKNRVKANYSGWKEGK